MSDGGLYLEYSYAKMHYVKLGNGQKILLAFHGYGQSLDNLRVLEKALGKEYTVYAFDLFYHGQSFWHGKENPVSKQFLEDMMLQFFKSHSISTFSLLGYSMGGKLALALLEKFPDKIERLIMIAPDGIKTSFWYNIATLPGLFRQAFRKIVVDPSLYYMLVNFLSNSKIVDKGVLRFANTQMQTRKQRRRVYYSWVIFRELRFDMKYMARLINSYEIDFSIYLGKYDKIITYKNLKRFISKLDNPQLHILDSGHTNLINLVTENYLKDKATQL